MNALAAELIRSFERLQGELHPCVHEMIHQVCEALMDGHVCCSLAECLEKSVALSSRYSLEQLREILRTSGIVGEVGSVHPFVLDRADRFYMARYAWYEQRLATRLQHFALLSKVNEGDERLRKAWLSKLSAVLNELFPSVVNDRPDWQKAAAAAAVLKGLCVISGGPGTGKTTTVVKILAALQEMAEGELVIRLAAPTGKAAARMSESIRQKKPSLKTEWVHTIPETASTLHRLLGVRLDSSNFRYTRERRLPLDVLVVDEASMIDLALMTKLLEALPDHATLIILGDRDQLDSVEAGAVLGQIAALQSYTPEFAADVDFLTGIKLPLDNKQFVPVGACVMTLTHSFRFGEQVGIGALVQSVNTGQAEQAIDLLEQCQYEDIVWVNADRWGEAKDFEVELIQRVGQAFIPYWDAVQSNDPVKAFEGLAKFRLLVAHREGELGVISLNKKMETYFIERYKPRQVSEWYAGKPIMVLENDYSSELFNGDIGIALSVSGEIRVAFEGEGGRIRWVSPARLPRYENAYVMTVHKSQGSEFDEVVLALPAYKLGGKSSLLNRNLFYTGITRARKRAEIWGTREVIRQAILTCPERVSGLSDRLRGSM